MMRLYELFIGLRYIRSRSRNGFVSFISLVSMLGIAVGVAVLIVVLSVMNGFETELRERILSMASHATITGLPAPLDDWRRVRDGALTHSEVSSAAPYIEGEGMLVSDEALTGFALRGIDPGPESEVARIGQHMQGPGLAALSSGSYRIILGRALADHLLVDVGDSVLLLISQANVTPAGLVPRMRRFYVADIFEVGMHEYDRGLAFVHLADAARLYRLGDAVTGVRLRLNDMFDAPQVVREVAVELGGGFYVTDWTGRHANFFRSIQLTKTVMFVILLLVVGVAAFNIVSTLVMVVKEKQGDIAIMRTFGSAPVSVMSVFVVQGALIGLLGTAAGLALGAVLAVNLEVLVRLLEQFIGSRVLAPDVYYISDLPAELRSVDLALICATALALALLSTLYPAWRASRTHPAEALRYE